MPLRGSLFRKLLATRKQKEEFRKQRVKKEAKVLKQLRRTRVTSEGRALLKQQIAFEKSRIKIAKGPSRIGRFERFLAKEGKIGAKAGLKAGIKELRKRRAKNKRKKR